jgi:hypothetical protein
MTTEGDGAGERPRAERPSPARIYDWYLGGKDNYEVDRLAGLAVEKVFPLIRVGARMNRAFMHRATRFLVAEEGIRQFLDIGTGIPTEPNLHQVAQQVAPQARVVYVDNDPVVLAHARALLVSVPEGRTAYVRGDITDPASILEAPALREILDLTRPVALSLVAVMHFVDEPHDAHGLVAGLMAALAPGSCLVMSHASSDIDGAGPTRDSDSDERPDIEAARAALADRGIRTRLRDRAEIGRFFHGLELVPPGLVQPQRWRPDEDVAFPPARDAELGGYAAVGRKPRR